jgi:hypothetical protein
MIQAIKNYWKDTHSGIDGRPSHSKTLSTIAFFLGCAVVVSLNVLLWFRASTGILGAMTTIFVATASLSFGLAGWKSFLNSRASTGIKFDDKPDSDLTLAPKDAAGNLVE